MASASAWTASCHTWVQVCPQVCLILDAFCVTKCFEAIDFNDNEHDSGPSALDDAAVPNCCVSRCRAHDTVQVSHWRWAEELPPLRLRLCPGSAPIFWDPDWWRGAFAMPKGRFTTPLVWPSHHEFGPVDDHDLDAQHAYCHDGQDIRPYLRGCHGRLPIQFDRGLAADDLRTCASTGASNFERAMDDTDDREILGVLLWIGTAGGGLVEGGYHREKRGPSWSPSRWSWWYTES